MSNSWPTVPIRKTYVGLFDGPHATPKPSDEGPVFLGIGNITEDGHLDLADVRHIAEDDYPTWTRRVTPQEGDIVFTYEATLNRYAIIPEGFRGCLGRRLALIRPNAEAVDTRFLYYSFFGPAWRRTISKNTLTGATVDRIPLVRFPNFEIALPALPTQRRIALILSAYDHLIENSARRMVILEKMARLIYHEWFGPFRFRGSEKMTMAESTTSTIPQGWDAIALGNHLAALEAGKRPKGGIRDVEDGVPSIGAENIKGIGRHDYAAEKFVPREFFSSMRRGVVRDRDVGLYKDGAYIGRSSFFRDGFPHTECCVNEHVFLLRSGSPRLTQNALYLWLQEEETISQVRSKNANAAQPGINQESVNSLMLRLPDVGTAIKFDELVEPMLATVVSLAKRNRVLRATRDLLLPKLISGEIDVSHLAKAPAAATV